MFKHYINMTQEIKEVRKWGNSAGVLVPREWLNGKVMIKLIEKPIDIKKDIFEILEPYMDDIQGIYLVGSYARNEQTEDSDIDIIAITGKTAKKVISSQKYNIEIYTLDSVKKTLISNPIMIYPRLMEAKPILNSTLLENLLKIEITKNSFKEFIEACRRIIKITKELINLDRIEEKNFTSSQGLVYPLILRFRGMYLLKCVINKEIYSFKDFKKWLSNNAYLKEGEFNELYEIYKNTRDNKMKKRNISIELAERLIKFLEKEVNKYG